MANRQVQALNEARVEFRGILGVEQCFVQLRFGAADQPPVRPVNPVVVEVLDDLSIDAQEAEDLGDDPCVRVQTVGGQQEGVREASSVQTLAQEEASNLIG